MLERILIILCVPVQSTNGIATLNRIVVHQQLAADAYVRMLVVLARPLP